MKPEARPCATSAPITPKMIWHCLLLWFMLIYQVHYHVAKNCGLKTRITLKCFPCVLRTGYANMSCSKEKWTGSHCTSGHNPNWTGRSEPWGTNIRNHLPCSFGYTSKVCWNRKDWGPVMNYFRSIKPVFQCISVNSGPHILISTWICKGQGMRLSSTHIVIWHDAGTVLSPDLLASKITVIYINKCSSNETILCDPNIDHRFLFYFGIDSKNHTCNNNDGDDNINDDHEQCAIEFLKVYYLGGGILEIPRNKIMIDIINDNFTVDEIKANIDALKNGETPGLDHISAEFVKMCNDDLAEIITCALN